jgi:hypothetical protein
MANSFQAWTWSTGDPLYRLVTIDFLSQDEVHLYDDGVEVSFTWDSSSQISFSAPANGSVMSLKRETDIDLRDVDFEDGNGLSEEDLDNSALQIFYKLQELSEAQLDGVVYDAADNKQNAQSKVIKNVADGVHNNDAVNVSQLQAAAIGTVPLTGITDRIAQNEGDIATLESDVDGLEEEMSNKASSSALTSHQSSEDHDNRYYTEAEVDALLANIIAPVDAPQTIISYTDDSGVESIDTTDSIWVLNTGALTGNKIAQGIKITCRKSGVDKVYTFSEDIDLGTLSANTTYYVVLEINSGSESKSVLASADVIVHLLSNPMCWKTTPDSGIDIIPEMASDNQNGYIVSSSGEYGSYYDWKVFDNSNASAEDTWVVPSSTISYVQIQLPSAKAVNTYKLSARNDLEYLSRTPKNWTFRGSNDGSNWTTLDTQSNITFSQGETKTFNFSNTTAYLYYKVDITGNGGDPEYTCIGELELFENSNTLYFDGFTAYIDSIYNIINSPIASSPVTAIMLGEITTDASQITNTVTYAFNGKKKITQTTTSGDTATITHNVGVEDIKVKINENNVLKHKDITLINQNSLSYSSTYSGSSIVTVSREDVA